MQLGKIHKSTLDKLYEADGEPLSSLHFAVSKLVAWGLAEETSAGYVITDKGRLVAEGKRELEPRHRMVMVQIYRSHADGVVIPPDKVDQVAAGELVSMGHLYVKHGYHMMTDAGLSYWENYVDGRGERKVNVRNAVRRNIRPFGESKDSHDDKSLDEVLEEPFYEESPECSDEHASSDCDECLHREVLELVMEKHPGIRDLYEHKKAIREHEQSVLDGLRRLGDG